MKKTTGRNDPCPCGSGKKHKKCCGSSVPSQTAAASSAGSKHYFREKGAAAERIIHNLATKTFLTDWCYANPKKPDGKELCDLLVVFDDTAIIWQIKDLKTDKDGRYKKAEVEKNLRQLSGARRSLFDLRVPIELENPRRGKERFEPDRIKSVHLISVLMGEGEEPFPFVEFVKSQKIHVFTREFADISLSELDTVSDFCAYLRSKESIDKEKILLVAGGARREMLELMCFVARGLYQDNNRVIGIATEAENRSYDFCLLVRPEWTAKDEEAKTRIQQATGIFINPRKTAESDDEYPMSA